MEKESKNVEMDNTNDLLHMQDTMINLLIRLTAIERILVQKNIIDQDSYKTTIESVGADVTAELKQMFEQENQTKNTK